MFKEELFNTPDEELEKTSLEIIKSIEEFDKNFKSEYQVFFKIRIYME